MAATKYTKEVLSQAAAASSSIAGVLRYLGVKQTGGSHHHISRRLKAFGIDTSHFTGQGSFGTRRSPRRLTPQQILTVRAAHRNRPSGARLAAALLQIGSPEECAGCGQGPLWQGQRLVLHVDHINGNFADCRPANLRFLCPNCHSQTRNFAGRGKHRTPVVARPLPAPDDEKRTTVADAARLLGCSTAHFYRLKGRLTENKEPEPHARRANWSEIIRCALAFPDEGPRKLAARLLTEEFGTIGVSHGTVSNVLASVGLNRAEARRSARIPVGKSGDGPVDSLGPAGVAEWQTRRP
jgi:hypothetical protein